MQVFLDGLMGLGNQKALTRNNSLVCTAEFEECTDFDCVFHGTATGNRRADDSCECICDAGYTGPQCRSIIGIAAVAGIFFQPIH